MSSLMLLTGRFKAPLLILHCDPMILCKMGVGLVVRSILVPRLLSSRNEHELGHGCIRRFHVIRIKVPGDLRDRSSYKVE
jgi:hypothetical protein